MRQENETTQIPYDQWKDDLRRFVAEKTGMHISEISVNDLIVEAIWKAGHSIEKVFEENFKSL